MVLRPEVLGEGDHRELHHVRSERPEHVEQYESLAPLVLLGFIGRYEQDGGSVNGRWQHHVHEGCIGQPAWCC